MEDLGEDGHEFYFNIYLSTRINIFKINKRLKKSDLYRAAKYLCNFSTRTAHRFDSDGGRECSGRVLYLLIPRRRDTPSPTFAPPLPCRARRARRGRVNNCRRNGPELCRPLSKSDKINHASRGHARCGRIHLSHPSARYPGG